jgi:tetratricopeptide (TPR) repeat protein
MNEEVRRLKEYVDANPNDADALRALANLNLQVNDFLRSRELYERYVRLRPEDPEGLLTLANLYYETREYARARDSFEAYLQIGPETAGALTDLGNCYRFLNQPERALDLLQRAERLDPRYWIALYNQILVLAFDFRDFTRADEVLGRLKQLQPANPDIENLAAEVERRRRAA